MPTTSSHFICWLPNEISRSVTTRGVPATSMRPSMLGVRAVWAAAPEAATTGASQRAASILPPQLKQFAEASGFFVPQRVQYISMSKSMTHAVDQRWAQNNHIFVHKTLYCRDEHRQCR